MRSLRRLARGSLSTGFARDRAFDSGVINGQLQGHAPAETIYGDGGNGDSDSRALRGCADRWVVSSCRNPEQKRTTWRVR